MMPSLVRGVSLKYGRPAGVRRAPAASPPPRRRARRRTARARARTARRPSSSASRRRLRARDRRLGVAQVALPVAGVRREDRPRELDAAAQRRLLAGLGARGLENEEPLPEAAGAARVRHVREPPERLGPRGDRREGRRPARRASRSRQARRPRRRGSRRRRGRAWPPPAPSPSGVSRRAWRASSAAMSAAPRSDTSLATSLEAGRQALVGPLGSQRQVQGALGRVSDPAGEVPVDRSPLDRASRRCRSPTRRAGGLKRTRVAGALDEPGRHGALEQVRRRRRAASTDGRDERGDLSSSRRSTRHRRRPPAPPPAPASVSGSSSRLARRQARARRRRRPSSRACERVPPDRSSTARSRARGRASPRRSRSIRPSAPRSIGPSSIRWTRSAPSASSSRRGGTPVAPARRDQPHRRLVESAEREAQRPGARLVEPLEVVDREDQGSRARGLLQGPEHGDGDQEVHGRRAIRLAAEEDRVERPRLGRGERRQHLVGEIRQEVDERGERERGLGLGRARRGRPEPAAAGLLEPLAPERRLADPGPARDHERPRPLGAVEEGADLGQLALATEQLGHARESMTPVRRRVLPGAAKGSP